MLAVVARDTVDLSSSCLHRFRIYIRMKCFVVDPSLLPAADLRTIERECKLLLGWMSLYQPRRLLINSYSLEESFVHGGNRTSALTIVEATNSLYHQHRTFPRRSPSSKLEAPKIQSSKRTRPCKHCVNNSNNSLF